MNQSASDNMPKQEVIQQDVIAVVTTGGYTGGVRCFHPKAASHNQFAVPGLAAAFAMPPISVDLLLLHSLFSVGAAGT